MIWRRPSWLWGAAAIVCLTGGLGGPALFAAGETVWTSLQPRTFVSGWGVVAVVALIGLVWLGMVYAVARILRGKAGLVFAVAAIGIAGATVLFEELQPPTKVTRFTLTGDEAAAWRNYHP